MEVKNPQAAVLSNYEVLELVNEAKNSISNTNLETSPLATITYEVSHYLQELPCKDQTAEKIERILTLLKDFPIKLTKLEKLMICNDPPETALQLCLIAKDCEILSDEDTQMWLQRIHDIKRGQTTRVDEDSGVLFEDQNDGALTALPAVMSGVPTLRDVPISKNNSCVTSPC